MYSIVTYEDNYLAHHGIKGQKWGLRRFQNEDGTLTIEGKERYGTMTRHDRKVFEKQVSKLEKYSQNADKGYQMRKAEIEKNKAKRNLKKGAIDAAVLLANKGVQELIVPKRVRSMVYAYDPNTYAANLVGHGLNNLIFGGASAIRLAKASAHGIKALNANRKASDKGNAKAIEKRNAQYNKMMEMYKGTPYSDILKKMG